MQKYRLSITYDGTKYSGWQIQPNALTIQELIQEKIAIFLQEKVSLVGSGRTDAGVHALEQVAHFKTYCKFDQGKFLVSINGLLPNDVRILEIQEVPDTFHAQRSAKSKIYHYHISTGSTQSPFKRDTSIHMWRTLDQSRIKAGAKYFVGTHDFTTFANSSSEGAAAKNAVRTIYRIDLVEELGGFRLEFEGNGFLYKMVRNIVGTLLAVATGQLSPENIPELLMAKDRRLAPKAAPARGLFLVKVKY